VGRAFQPALFVVIEYVLTISKLHSNLNERREREKREKREREK
jgi:hypothetical protein